MARLERANALVVAVGYRREGTATPMFAEIFATSCARAPLRSRVPASGGGRTRPRLPQDAGQQAAWRGTGYAADLIAEHGLGRTSTPGTGVPGTVDHSRSAPPWTRSCPADGPPTDRRRGRRSRGVTGGGREKERRWRRPPAPRSPSGGPSAAATGQRPATWRGLAAGPTLAAHASSTAADVAPVAAAARAVASRASAGRFVDREWTPPRRMRQVRRRAGAGWRSASPLLSTLAMVQASGGKPAIASGPRRPRRA